MQNNSSLPKSYRDLLGGSLSNISIPRQVIVGGILVLALIAFEMFNFDTTRYALENLLGGVSFLGISWAVILAIAFCAIDFAGLARIFTAEQGKDEPKEVWYLAGAWFLGATMNAIMTWWAVSLVLLNHSFGNEILNRQQLLEYVPIFVAVLVWLTRILFIGAFAAAGDKMFRENRASKQQQPAASQARSQRPRPTTSQPNVLPAGQYATAAPTRSNSQSLPQRPPVSSNRQPASMSFSPPQER